ncbi:hypothetical protein TSUD_411230, partial [Trifolium subterraneum]
VVESFPLKMWVCVSDDFELKNVLLKILNSASVSNSNPIHQENIDVEQLQNHLRNKLVGQKFLLVLDDVWNEDRVKWEELKDIIQGFAGAEGSKVLATTRSHIVANVMGTTSSHILQGLSSKDSLSVFVKWAFKEGEVENYPELKKIGEEIVKKCGGLPLALRTLGSSLFLKFDIEDWKNALRKDELGLEIMQISVPTITALAADPIASLIDTAFIGHIGPVELDSVGVSIAIFNQVSKIAIIPLVSVTTSLVAEEDAAVKLQSEPSVKEMLIKASLVNEEIQLEVVENIEQSAGISFHLQ